MKLLTLTDKQVRSKFDGEVCIECGATVKLGNFRFNDPNYPYGYMRKHLEWHLNLCP